MLGNWWSHRSLVSGMDVLPQQAHGWCHSGGELCACSCAARSGSRISTLADLEELQAFACGICSELNILSDSTNPLAVSAPQLSNENLTFIAKNNDICCSVSTIRRIIPLDEIKSASVEDGCILNMKGVKMVGCRWLSCSPIQIRLQICSYMPYRTGQRQPVQRATQQLGLRWR